MKRPVIKRTDLEMAFEFVCGGAPMEHHAYVSLDTGEIHYHSEYGDNEELPDDIDSDRYLEIPHKNDLDLGKRLVLKFAAEFLTDKYDKVREIFSQRGAYARFRDLLEYSGKLDQWRAYEAQATHDAMMQWCSDNGIELEG